MFNRVIIFEFASLYILLYHYNHVQLFQDGLISLLPRVVDLVGDRNIPVIAAGGIVDERGYVAAFALGAQGICLGTRYTYLTYVYTHY